MTLDELVKVLLCQDRAYRRDECGDWCIAGKAGHIYALPEGFYLFCDPGSARAWSFVKKALAFAKVTQDGDEDGVLLLDRLPSPEEADVIRDKLRIRRKRMLGEEALAVLRKAGDKGRFQPRRLATEG